MQLYFLRHADALPIAESDEARPLSDKGEAQAQKVARFCEAHGLIPDIILTSPFRRAHQTARIVAEHLRAELVSAPFLASGMEPDAGLDALKEYAKFRAVMIVGHEPDFSSLAAHLLGLPSNQSIHVRKAALLLLELESLRAGVARLEFSIPSRLT